ncbi:hypothetical protein [Streptomyces lavendofoliae]|uniref:Extensin n=1 Tax=Streptomyces lavendofoliae TaxID=67314 RepID=A0A918HW44_9ACTN|nr:hypothetical protein [Streptomyces lavendofoliae]GGU36028.1 hypothetical protein GCM10010274_24200 [Streptomyces lavendofoliae]
MADERDEWLDQDAAENLLRGEPVGPVDDHARERARRVERALDALRATSGPATDRLPGEEAALAAFRAARAERTAGARAALGTSGGPEAADAGRVRPRPGPRERMRWARPVRWGLAASVAGLAVGGVAVGAGTGVLPVLGGDSEPLPAASVSADGTPDAAPTGGTTTGPGSATPGTAAGGPGGKAPSASATPGGDGERVPGRPDPEGGGDARDGDVTGGPTGGHPADVAGAGSGSVAGPDGDASWFARTARDCRDYRDGRLDRDRREKLEAAANGAAKLKVLCDKVLGGDLSYENGSTGAGAGGPGPGAGSGWGGAGSGGPGSGGSGGSGGGSGPGGGWGGGGDGKGHDGGDSDAARPSASWRPLAPPLTVRRTGPVF